MNIPENTALMVNNRVYYVEKAIAEKKTGGVWRLKNYSGRHYALKIMYEGGHKEFLFKLSVLQKIKYRHFVEIEHFGQLPTKKQSPVLEGDVWKPRKGGLPFLLMPFAEYDLCTFLKQEIEPRKRITLALQFCLAVRKIHSYLVENPSGRPERFFHGNLKPANVLLFPGRNTYTLKIADLGITTRAPESPYLAPEQRKNVGINFRCDLFAASKILREVLSGVRLPDSLGEMEHELPQRRGNALGRIIKELTAEQKHLQNEKMGHNLLLLGIQLYQQGHFQYALKDFENSLKLVPSTLACIYKGNTLRELGDTEEALACYQQAMEMDNRDARAFENRGELYAEQGRYEEAVQDFKRAIELDPESASSHGSLGMVYMELKLYQKSLEHFDALLAISNDFPPTYVDRGDVLMKLERYREAAEDYEKALQLKAEPSEEIREKLEKARKSAAGNLL